MMTYTIQAAQYANEDNTAAVIVTEEAGAVLLSAVDTPDLWAEMLAWGAPDPFVRQLIATRSVAMWRARTIMKVTPWGEGTLFDAVQAAIAGLEDPLQKASAEEALDRGDVFDRDGVFVPLLAAAVGISDEQLDELIGQAAGLPA